MKYKITKLSARSSYVLDCAHKRNMMSSYQFTLMKKVQFIDKIGVNTNNLERGVKNAVQDTVRK